MSPNPMYKTVLRACLLSSSFFPVTAHSNLITPKPRNAIDSLLPGWQNGTAPCKDLGTCTDVRQSLAAIPPHGE